MRVVTRIIQHVVSRRRLMVNGSARSGAVALTFDDGPHPQHTERLLEVLARERVPGTFFMVGSEVQKYPALARAVVQGGHAVGGHSFSHRRPNGMSRRALAEEIDRTSAIIEETTGARPTLFRPPYGGVTFPLLLCAWSRALTVVLWSVDSRDSVGEASSVAFRRQVGAADAGDILLFHDDCGDTVEALGVVIQELKSRGLRFATVDEWVRSR